MKIFFKLSFLVVYIFFLDRIYKLLYLGGVRARLPIIVGLFLVLLIITGVTFYTSHRQKENSTNRKNNNKEKIFHYIFIIMVGIITINAGYKIYLSGTNYGGKLAWYLDQWIRQEKVKLEQHNLYESGIDGIIEDLKTKINLPKQLYLGESFSLNFNEDGEIKKFEFSIYGKNEQNETKGYLVVYNKKTSDKMTVYKGSYVGDSYQKTKQLELLQDTVNAVFLNRPFQTWSKLKKTYALTYYGERDWGYNSQGIIYINGKQEERKAANPFAKIVGCTLSVTFEGYDENVFPEEEYIPHRYLLMDDLKTIAWEDPDSQMVKEEEKERLEEMEKEKVAAEYYPDVEIGYRLYEVDAALGSRFYSLLKTVNGGEEWTAVNTDPFNGMSGMGVELQFLDKDLGFLYLRHNAGDNGEVYITRDGGISVSVISLELPEIDLGGTLYQVYDTPKNVRKEEGELILEVGQGNDGDYNGGDSINFYSDDQGKTWHQK